MIVTALLLGATMAQLPAVAKTSSRTPILTYHDMVPVRDGKALWFDCTPRELESQLDWLTQRGARFVSLRDLEESLAGSRPLPKNAVVVTFADNYLGFYRHALPILRKRRVPVAMFVHTDFVGSRRGRPKMSWVQLKELDREGLVTVCSQTRSHPEDLTRLNSTRLREEMEGSKRALETQLGHEVPYIAYPNGKYDARVAKAAFDAGYRLGFTEAQKPAERAPNLFMIPRYVHTKYREAWRDAH
jgi:peptidoglycan/xylan/chitin deacetylase (PgdA/CDA1 family)